MPRYIPFLLLICHSSFLVYYVRLSRAIHPHNFSRPAGAQFFYRITCLATSHFVSVWARNRLSAISFFSHIYTNSLVWIYLNMFRFVSCFMWPIWLWVSAEPSINTFLVGWLVRNILIALPASPKQTLFWFAQTIPILLVYLYIWVWTCFYMFYSQCFTSFRPTIAS